MDSLVNDQNYFGSPPNDCLGDWLGSWTDVRDMVYTLLGVNYPLRWENASIHRTGLTLYDVLSELFPMSPQNAFFWKKFAKPFASMMEIAAFPLDIRCRFLTFVYARVIGMMGPHDNVSQGSIMTFDGSPVELSWIVPTSEKQKYRDRQIRFAVEPIDPRTGEPLCGNEVLNYLVSASGSLGLVDCPQDGMNWRRTVESFLFPAETGPRIPKGSRFMVGFDFAPTGAITLKAYYIPSPRPPFGVKDANSQQRSLYLWDSDWTCLRRLIPQLHPSLLAPLEKLISFVDSLDWHLKPRIQILSVDCVGSNINRLKIYCRPTEGASWTDACTMFTLGGKISSSPMSGALANLEILWNYLFPNYPTTSCCQLDIPFGKRSRQHLCARKRNKDHPTKGLLYYFSLHVGVDIPLPKIYLPVSRYCKNDLQICNAMEQAYIFDALRRDSGPVNSDGWVAREVSKVFKHRELKTHTGIHTYVTLSFKGKDWDITSYFSPEVWS